MTELEVPRGKWVGARVKRIEDPRYLTGEARYIADLKVPGVLHAAFVRSPYAHAWIRSIDTAAAAAAEGVAAVLTGADVTAFPLADILVLEGLAKTPQPVLATDRVRFVGEAVAVVVADDPYRAEDAAAQVAVDYEELPAVLDVDAATADGATLLHEELGTNVLYRKTTTCGDPEAAFARADRVFRRRFHTNRFVASPMETRGCLAEYEPASERLTLWSSTQNPHLLRLTVAGVLGMPTQRLRVVAPDVGGGFGQKAATYPEEVVVAFLARALRRPVRWIEDRRENLLAATHAKEQVIDLEVAVDADGTLLGMRARYLGDAGAYSWNTTSALIEPQLAGTLGPSVYELRDYEYEVAAAVTNKTPVGPYRGVGWTAGHTARELLFDEIARDLGLDPAEFRRRNMIASDRLPYESCTGALYDSGSFVESFERALELIGYDELRREQEELRKQGCYIGIGISPYVEPTAWGTEVAGQGGFPLPSHDNATVTVDPSGKVTVAVSVTTQGQGHKTSLAQLAADVLGVNPQDVTVLQEDTDVTPFGMGTYASRAAVIGGGSLALAAKDVRRKIVEAAATLLEASADDIVLEDSRVYVAGSPDRGLALGEVAGAAYFAPFLRREGEDPFLSSTRFYDPRATYSNGCLVAVAEVDMETGLVRLRRIVSVEDCGTVLNPTIVEGQVHGAVAQGIGGALLEEIVYDEWGQPVTTTFMDYLLPTALDVPPIDVEHLETPSPFTVGGIKGMGESGLIASPAAVAGAVLDALAPFDARPERFPLKPERILRLAGRLPAET